MSVSELRRLAEQEEPWWAADYEVMRNSLPALLACVEAAQMQCELHPSETVPHLFRALAALGGEQT